VKSNDRRVSNQAKVPVQQRVASKNFDFFKRINRLAMATPDAIESVKIMNIFQKRYLKDQKSLGRSEVESFENEYGKTVQVMAPQECFGIKEFGQNEMYRFSAVMLTNCQVLMILKSDFPNLIRESTPANRQKVKEFLRLVLNWGSIGLPANNIGVYTFNSYMKET
jgi:hypothetical protein